MKSDYAIERYVDVINHALDGCIAACGDERDKVTSAMKYSLKNGGKRIRPVLTLEFARVCGAEPEAALPFACAVEMIHTYSLIHDDLPCMDNDDMRRGQPSCHIRFGEATALLAGDALLTLAFKVLCAAKIEAGLVLNAVTCLADCAGFCGMIGGQCFDLLNENKEVGADVLKKTDLLKTGELIKCACELGCIAAGADEEKICAARSYAESIGLAFQIVDDLLDVTSTPEELGKPVGSDALNNKSTYLTLLGIEKCKAEVNELTQNAVSALRVFGDEGIILAELAQKLAARTK